MSRARGHTAPEPQNQAWNQALRAAACTADERAGCGRQRRGTQAVCKEELTRNRECTMATTTPRYSPTGFCRGHRLPPDSGGGRKHSLFSELPPQCCSAEHRAPLADQVSAGERLSAIWDASPSGCPSHNKGVSWDWCKRREQDSFPFRVSETGITQLGESRAVLCS